MFQSNVTAKKYSDFVHVPVIYKNLKMDDKADKTLSKYLILCNISGITKRIVNQQFYHKPAARCKSARY